MALKTQGFALSALPSAPKIPGNVGQIDVKEIYDGVRRGLETIEAVRRAPAGMALADAQMAAATEQAPLATRGILAQTEAAEQQLPIKTGILAQQAEAARKQAPFKQAQLEFESSPEYLDAKMQHLLRTNGMPAGQQEFEALIASFSPEEQAAARRVRAGLTGRASGAAIKYMKFMGEDGREYTMGVDPNLIGAQVIGTGQTFGSGVRRPGDAAVLPGAAPVQVTPIAAPAEVDELGNPIVVAPVAQAAAPAAAPTTSPAGNIFQSPTIGEKKTQEVTAGKTAEMQIEAKAKLPKALTSLKTLEANTERINRDIDEAIANTNGKTAGFGAYLSGIPTSGAKTLEAQIASIAARIGFDELTNMRQNSPTGGALGNVSDYEGRNLQSTIARLDQKLDPEVLKKFLRRVKEVRNEAVSRARENFDRDVNYFGLTDADFTLQANEAKKPLPLPGAPAEFKIIEVK